DDKFFFSSRRRHTISKRDWSSDVCSSDLMTDSVNQAQIAVLCEEDSLPWKIVKPLYEQQIEFNYLEEELLNQCVIKNGEIHIARSEERRVGKSINIGSKCGCRKKRTEQHK